jgi:hypothetical protein
MAVIIADMTGYINQAMAMAKSEPYLLVIRRKYGIGNANSVHSPLVSDVSGYILKEGNNVLADYNSRDQLLRKVITQLQILDGLAYGTWKAMYWAKERGVIAALNPFSNFISEDIRLVNETIKNAKYLRNDPHPRFRMIA